MDPRNKEVVPLPSDCERDVQQRAQRAYKLAAADERTERNGSNPEPIEERDTFDGCH